MTMESSTLSWTAKYIHFFTHSRPTWRGCDLVRQRNPNLIHIHVTERYFGLLPARKMISTPCVISLQACWYLMWTRFFAVITAGHLAQRTIHRSGDAARPALALSDYCKRLGEREILQGAKTVLAGPLDRAHAWSMNRKPSIITGRMLRKRLQASAMDVSRCERHSIIFTNAGDPSADGNTAAP